MRGDANWGSNTSGDGGINVKITGSLSGVPLPSPEVVTEGAAANDSEGLYKTEEATPPPPAEDAIPDSGNESARESHTAETETTARRASEKSKPSPTARTRSANKRRTLRTRRATGARIRPVLNGCRTGGYRLR